MDSRRFFLRFESGGRKGDEISLDEGVTTIGRSSSNDVVVSDTSISGRHAELRFEAGRAALRDLGSTNGTRVGRERIDEKILEHGDVIQLGTVRVVFLDEDALDQHTIAERRLTEHATGTRTGPVHEAGEGMRRIDAAALAGRRGRPVVLLALGLALVFAGAFAWWSLVARPEEQGVAPAAPSVPGNLIADGSFEEGSVSWEMAEAAPQAFFPDPAFAASGGLGLGVTLEADEWSLALSPPVEVSDRRALSLAGSLWAEKEAEARLGLRLSSSSGAGPAFLAWAPSLRRSDGFEVVRLSFPAVPGYDSVSVAVAARSGGAGAASLDDLALTQDETPGPPAATFHEYELTCLGDPGSTAVLQRSGRLLLGGLQPGSWGSAGLTGWAGARLGAEATESGVAVLTEGAPADSTWRLFALLGPDDASAGEESWVASIGPGGYRPHSAEFEVESATSLLLGEGVDLLRIGFGRPVAIAGQTSDGVLRLRCRGAELDRIELQLTFHEERAEARRLRELAHEAQRRGSPGDALDAWTEVLSRFPFEREIVREAEAERGRLVQAGLAEVEDLRRELERARFFGVEELLRACETGAREIAATYRSTEIAAEALRLSGEVEEELARGGSGTDPELERLRAVRAATADQAPALSEHVGQALKRRGDL